MRDHRVKVKSVNTKQTAIPDNQGLCIQAPVTDTAMHVKCTKLEDPHEEKNLTILSFSRGTTVKTTCISFWYYSLCMCVV